ncbi:hypothetical protein C2E25_05480 [Geothermobacter hydrogeniphilus]|uniref:histidine kinase n=1 Tax=Geothermobacter hydrogeniphilus TaxID=1969733 RepID=A0A2K2HC16_9BACT|nr:ATP-binding protein [Geothermobacter hydrogeniphilus]PNU20836.1 hypothetical protein C2E25_05480 [Geothermobacter hydrogeniphilus]
MNAEAGYFILYLFYGLVFFMIGASITSRNLRASDLKVAEFFWVFALFAYLHGLNEWFVLFIRENPDFIQGPMSAYLLSGRILLLGGSFGLLFWFGLELLLWNSRSRKLWMLIVFLVALVGIGPIVIGYFQRGYAHFDLYLRNFIGFPGAVLSGVGLIKYSSSVESLSRRGAKNLTYAGYAILLYGFFTGIFPTGWNLGGVPIEFFRACSALLIFFGITRALQIFDVERRAKIQAQLKRFTQSEKLVALGKLSAGIAHEINNPLAKVLLNVEMLEKDLNREGRFDTTRQTRIDAIKRNLERAAKIAGELLFFSHNRETEFVAFSLNEVVHKTFQLIGSRQDLYDFEFEPGEIPKIQGVPWKIEEVLLNLLMNAMEASEPGGGIKVRTWVEQGMVVCTVEDQGSGISEKDLNFVMDPFFTTKEIGKGTGLGLAICFGIMELHGGEVLISSREGEGTTVRLQFPCEEE